MIVPSIDLQSGHAVQLVGGRELAVDAGDPRPIARKFGLVGEIAVIDLDAATGEGSNHEVINNLLATARCRVGGGIRTVDAAIRWLDAGAAKVILGTAARPDVLRELPPDRTIAALDANHGEVMVEGWREGTGETILSRMREIRDSVGGFLVTFIEREGRMTGLDLEVVANLREECGDARLTVAGGVASIEEIAELERMGVDCQVGMALYTGAFDLADVLAAMLSSDRADGLWPTIVCDEAGRALGLVYSNAASLRAAMDTQRGVYHSRTRGTWMKGETSGNTQQLLGIDFDCDRDCLRFTVRQHGAGFCHLLTDTCFGNLGGFAALERTLRQRIESAPEGSYSRKLFDDPELLAAKIVEEANELADARSRDEVTWEAADVIFFAMAAMVRSGVSLADVMAELDRRSLSVTRRSAEKEAEL